MWCIQIHSSSAEFTSTRLGRHDLFSGPSANPKIQPMSKAPVSIKLPHHIPHAILTASSPR